MEKIKLENFSKEYPGRDFPEYISLNKRDCSVLAQSIQESFLLKDINDGLALVKAIEKLSKPFKYAPYVGEKFDLIETLSACEINVADSVYINWYRFDRIDKMKFVDLASHFYDIWYPGVDDIDIFDESISWMLSVRHDGRVKLLR